MKYLFYGIVALMMLFLVGEAAVYQGRLTRGKTVYLKVIPSDPRSMFMGNYATLRYDVSEIPVTLFPAAERKQLAGDQTVYVGLTTDRPARAVRASRTRPTDDGDLVWVRGRTTWMFDRFDPKGQPLRVAINVEYGLERFYLSESRGKQMDTLSRQLWDSKTPPTITAVASVGSNGTGMLKDVLVNGKSVNGER
jgi:uncharacterized membrane-anchored protein